MDQRLGAIEGDGRLAATLPRGRDEQLRLVEKDYNGTPYFDLRIWYRRDANSPWLPTKKGVPIRRWMLPVLAEALLATADDVRSREK